MMSTAEAKELYAEMSSIRGKHLGPYIITDSTDILRASVLRDRANELVSVYDLSKSVMHVASPWHAAILLNTLVQTTTSGRKQHDTHDGTPLLSFGPRFIFRGQSDSSWDLVASIDRRTTDRQAEVQIYTTFRAALNTELESLLKLDEIAVKATAQHYGIATNLLDFSLDPDVATYFAATGPMRSSGQKGVVYVLPLSKALRVGARVVLPPPFVERLYTQRGLFVESTGQTELKTRCIQVRFTPDSSFRVIRDGREIDLLKEEDPWLGSLARQARSVEGESNARLNLAQHVQPNKTGVSSELTAGLEHPAFRNLNRRSLFEKWFGQTVEMLYWIAITRLGGSESLDGFEVIDKRDLMPIVRDNLKLIESLAYEYDAALGPMRFDSERETHEDIRSFARVLRDAVKSAEDERRRGAN